MTRDQYYFNYNKFLEYQAKVSRRQGVVLVFCVLLTGLAAWWILILDPPLTLVLVSVLLWFAILVTTLVVGRQKTHQKMAELHLLCPRCKVAYSDTQLVLLAFTGCCPECSTRVFQ